ncbi:MAG: LPXTG cell wall anchor domain-containing protein [Dermatophilaceae bacterium]
MIPTTPGDSGGGLAQTGTSPLPALGVGAALVGAGVLLVVAARRRSAIRRH